MAESNGNGKNVSWKWFTGMLAGILILVSGAVLADMKTEIKQKVDKCQYEKDMKELKESISEDIREIKETLKEMQKRR